MRQPPLEEMRARFDSAEDERCLSVAAGLTLWRPGRLGLRNQLANIEG